MSSDKTEPAEKTPGKGKGKRLLVRLVVGLTLAGAGGGATYALVHSGMVGGPQASQDNKPKLIRKGEEDPYAPKTEAKDGETVHGEGGSAYRTVYYNFTDDFTSNLRDSDALIQLSVAASTRRDGRVLQWVRTHELAIRSAMLAVLAETPEDDIMSVAGKERLQMRLTAAINKVLINAEGFGGIDAVYFKSFIIQ